MAGNAVAVYCRICIVGESLNVADFARCSKCGHGYFLDRYNNKEISALYANYRGDRYYNIRHQYEFWYTHDTNNDLGEDSKTIDLRKKHLLQILDRNNIKAGVLFVIDWGGDHGQFIPDILPERFVYEISDAKPVAGVTKLADMQDVMIRQFDIVMNCNVFEHSSNPNEMMQLLAGLSAKFIYILVPFEPFKIIRIMPSIWYRKYIKFVSSLPRLRSLVDLFTILCRLKLRLIPPFGILMQHEHLNYFTKDSIAHLCISNGFEPIEISRFNFSFGIGAESLVCLARKK